MISVADIHKSFNQTKVLQGASFLVNEGETVGILGANGVGKTTLFRIMSGLIKPDQGLVTLDGKIPQNRKADTLSVFFGGASTLYERLSARENINYFARLNGIPDDAIKERTDSFATMLDMASYLDRKALNFSHGMKQKTALVRSIINDPDILFLDEPTLGMDVPAFESVISFVKELSSKGKTILYSSHNIAELEKICNRILIMHEGRIQKDIKLETYKEYTPSKTEKEYLKILCK